MLPRIVVFDRLANEKLEDFRNRYPTISDHCRLVPEQMEARSPQLIPELIKYLEEPDALSTVVFCFDNNTQNMLLGLQIDNKNLIERFNFFQTFIRTDDESYISFEKSLKIEDLPAADASGRLSEKLGSFCPHVSKRGVPS